jgi:hypothetical protein
LQRQIGFDRSRIAASGLSEFPLSGLLNQLQAVVDARIAPRTNAFNLPVLKNFGTQRTTSSSHLPQNEKPKEF